MSRAHAFQHFQITDDDLPLIERLQANYKEILLLSRTEKTSTLAATLGIAPGTAKSRLNRARHALVALRPRTP